MKVRVSGENSASRLL